MSLRYTSLIASLAIACAGVSAQAKEAPVKPHRADVDSLVRYVVPDQWDVEKDTAASDPYVRLSKGRHLLIVRLFGSKGSRFASPKDYVDSPAARATGQPPEVVDAAVVAGIKTTIYRTAYPINLGDPHVEGAKTELADELFCVVPLKGRFLVLSYAYESAIPDPDLDGTAVWREFLSGFKLRKK